MLPRLCMCNIFGPDAARAADFAFQHGFAGIDWTPDPREPEKEFLARMEDLCGLEVRLHCRFPGADMAQAGDRGGDALELHLQWAERAALAGIRQMTVELGGDSDAGEGPSFEEGVRNLKRLMETAADMGVTVAIENLVSPFSGDPFIFNALVAASGCAVTLDIGNTHAWKRHHPGVRCLDYVAPCRQRVASAHIHHAGAAPSLSSDLAARLDLLLALPSCSWWVVEIQNARDLLRTRELVDEHVSRSIQPPLATGLILFPYGGNLQPA